MYNQAPMKGGAGFAGDPPPMPPYEKKNEKKEEKSNKIKKTDQKYHNAVYKWIKSDEFRAGNPSHPIFPLRKSNPT